jgi:hypothetical protein
VFGTFFESFLAVEDFTSNTSARFGGSTQGCFRKRWGLHQGIERFGVVSLPGLVAGFDLDFTALSYI